MLKVGTCGNLRPLTELPIRTLAVRVPSISGRHIRVQCAAVSDKVGKVVMAPELHNEPTVSTVSAYGNNGYMGKTPSNTPAFEHVQKTKAAVPPNQKAEVQAPLWLVRMAVHRCCSYCPHHLLILLMHVIF
jgi:hypothetical protein